MFIYNRSLNDDAFKLDNNKKNSNLHGFLLGRCAINFLIKNLNIKSVLIPAFSCPVIPDILNYHNVKIHYYDHIDETLTLDLGQLELAINKYGDKIDMMIWIDYWGIVGDMPPVFYEKTRENNIITFVDSVHSLPVINYKSDFVLYTLRKLLNTSFGALLFSKEDISAYYMQQSEYNYLKRSLINFNHSLKKLLLSSSFKNKRKMIEKIFLFERQLFGSVVDFDSSSDIMRNEIFRYEKANEILSSFDISKIACKRRVNFAHYSNFFPSHRFNQDDISPLGFPHLSLHRDKLRNYLWKLGINTFTMWSDLHSDVYSKNFER